MRDINKNEEKTLKKVTIRKNNKNFLFVYLLLFLVTVLLVGAYVLEFDKNNFLPIIINDSNKEESSNSDQIVYSENSNPKYNEEFFVYNQIENVDLSTNDVYSILYNESKLKRSCFPVFDGKSNVTFLRNGQKDDSDKKRYMEIEEYLQSDKLLPYNLSLLPQNINNGNNGVSCMLMQNGTNMVTTAVGIQKNIYGNNCFSIVVSDDFGDVKNEFINTHIVQFRDLSKSKTCSIINDKQVAICYVYQNRFCKEKNIYEERYIYYAFYIKQSKEYLLQFNSNYTLENSAQNAYGIVGRSQYECKEIFEDIASQLI